MVRNGPPVPIVAGNALGNRAGKLAGFYQPPVVFV
jgi:hypothetical protein